MNTTATTDDVTTLTTQTNWPGGISTQKMIDDGFVDVDTVDEAVQRIDEYFVPEDKSAETRCIDGRCDNCSEEAHLGAQVPGGTAGAALAYRLGILVDRFDVGTFVDDSAVMLDNVVKLGFVPGDHRDTNGRGVGCGAIDKMDLALAAMINPALVPDHERLVRSLLGGAFDEMLYMQIMGAAVILQSRSSEYLAGREKSIEQIEEQLHHRVSVLEGEHHECLCIINLVPGTTFATKRFSAEFNGMQAFNYDVWRTFEFADKLFGDRDDDAKQRFVMARIMTAAATLMVLTDGTQRLVVRSA